MRMLAAVLSLCVLSTAAVAQQPAYKLTWAAATIGPQGPVSGSIPEFTTFKSENDCIAFGNTMAPRVRDWVRGRMNADWDHPVGVQFVCEISGPPA
jgi:hypothetical protein